MLIFWSLVRNSVVLAVYLLFSVACFLTVHEHYIEGDNLEVLKLLQRGYHGKIKMVYIDPPYNTGHDFVYKDRFGDTLENYIEQAGLMGQSNADTSGSYHANWCSMMYPRLRLARELLADDGAIFVSIDDNEVTNLTKLMDEIFGERNRIALICHKARASVSNDKIISPNHNTIAFYAKNIDSLEAIRKTIGLDPNLEGFDLDDADGRGAYRLVPVDGPGGAKKVIRSSSSLELRVIGGSLKRQCKKSTRRGLL